MRAMMAVLTSMTTSRAACPTAVTAQLRTADRFRPPGISWLPIQGRSDISTARASAAGLSAASPSLPTGVRAPSVMSGLLPGTLLGTLDVQLRHQLVEGRPADAQLQRRRPH